MKVDWRYFDQQTLKYKLLAADDMRFYNEPIGEKEKKLLQYFTELNTNKSTQYNIDKFFETLCELLDYVNEKGDYKDGRDYI